jgi:predicted TPR repeat methyltransferase
MEGYGAPTYGDRWADVYDSWVRVRLDEAGTQKLIDLLAELAAGGRVLELGIGTGRIALPSPSAGLRSMASTRRRRWSPSSVTSLGVLRSP